MKIYRYLYIPCLIFCIAAVCLVISYWGQYLHSQSFCYIVLDNKILVANPDGHTVRSLVKKYGIALNKNDLVSPAIDSPAPRGGRIEITHVLEKLETKESISPAKLKKKKKLVLNLRPVELQKAEQKITQTLIKTTFYNGKLFKRAPVSEHTVTKTFYLLNLIDKKGKIEKQYDLSKCRKIKMIATAYYPGDPLAWEDGTETLLGLKMQKGIVAVDPKVIPLRTRVFIPGYGYGYAGDTGSAIKGKRIDLGLDDGKDDLLWINRPVTVYILEKNKTW